MTRPRSLWCCEDLVPIDTDQHNRTVTDQQKEQYV